MQNTLVMVAGWEWSWRKKSTWDWNKALTNSFEHQTRVSRCIDPYDAQQASTHLSKLQGFQIP